MRMIRELFIAFVIDPSVKKDVTAFITSSLTTGQQLLQNATGKPSGPGILRSCIRNKVDFISSRVGIQQRASLSLSDMNVKIKSSRWAGKLTSSIVKRSLNFSRKFCLISFESNTLLPSSPLTTSILSQRLQMIVDKWKKLVFLSHAFNQSSQDFCCHNPSLHMSHSFSLAWSAASILPLETKGSAFWTSKIFWMRVLILTWQSPNTSLFHFRRALQVPSCILHNLEYYEPLTSSFYALSMTEQHLGSLVHVASKRKGLWAKESLGQVSKRSGEWFELMALRCEMQALGKASLHAMFVKPLSSLLLTAALLNLYLAHVNLFLENPKSIALNSNIRSLR